MYNIPPKTLFIGKSLFFLPTCHSTNDIAYDLLQSKPSTTEGTVIIALEQSAGKGQRENKWESEAGKNLTFSLILHPRFIVPDEGFYLNIIISLAVATTIKCFTKSDTVKIKWPNDIYIKEFKVSGILIQNTIKNAAIYNSIVGIGLNVNQDHFKESKALSLKMLTNAEFTLPDILHSLLENIEVNYLRLRDGDRIALKKEYSENLYWLDEKRIFIADNKHFEGIIRSIGGDGKMNVEVDKKIVSFNSKEIKFFK